MPGRYPHSSTFFTFFHVLPGREKPQNGDKTGQNYTATPLPTVRNGTVFDRAVFPDTVCSADADAGRRSSVWTGGVPGRTRYSRVGQGCTPPRVPPPCTPPCPHRHHVQHDVTGPPYPHTRRRRTTLGRVAFSKGRRSLSGQGSQASLEEEDHSGQGSQASLRTGGVSGQSYPGFPKNRRSLWAELPAFFPGLLRARE